MPAFTGVEGPYELQILNDTPVAYWRMNELGGATVTDAVGGHDLTITSATAGAVPFYGAPSALAQGGTSIRWTTTNSPYGTRAFDATLNPAGAFSVEFWVRRETLASANYRVVASTNNTNTGYEFQVTTGKILAFFITGVGSLSSAVLADNTWYHAVGTYDGTSQRLYINGSLVAGPTARTFAANTTADFVISGTSVTHTAQFPGCMDEVAFYNYALNQTQITSHYNAGLKPPNATEVAIVSPKVVVDGDGYADQYKSTILADLPAGYWRLGDPWVASVNTLQEVVAGRNLTTVGTALTLGQPGIPGSPDKAITFPGQASSSASRTPLDAALSPTGAFSIEAWARPTGNAGLYRAIASTREPSTPFRGFTLFAYNNDTWGFQGWNGNTFAGTSSGPAVVLGDWAHVVGVYDPMVGIRVYLNAVSGPTIGHTMLPATSGGFYIGRPGDASNFPWVGDLDEIALYPYALTQAQITEHYNVGLAKTGTAVETITFPAKAPADTDGSIDQYSTAVIADTPIAYWRLGETSGTTFADLIAGRNLTMVQPPVLGQPGALVSSTDKAPVFNGTFHYAERASDPALNPTFPLSIELWGRWDGGNPTLNCGLLFNRNASAVKGYAIIKQANALNFYISYGDGSSQRSILAAITQGQWYHLVFSHDGTRGRLYSNGIEVGTSVVSGYIPNDPQPLRIATPSYTLSPYFNGAIDEVAIYGYVLSPAQIARHYALGQAQVGTQESADVPIKADADASFASDIIASLLREVPDAGLYTDSIDLTQTLAYIASTDAATVGEIADILAYIVSIDAATVNELADTLIAAGMSLEIVRSILTRKDLVSSLVGGGSRSVITRRDPGNQLQRVGAGGSLKRRDNGTDISD